MTQIVRQWWTDRTGREQSLLVGLGLIAMLFIVYQFAMRPLMEYRAAAAAANHDALAYLKDVEESAADIISAQNLIKVDAGADIQSIRAVVSAAAREAGLSITRLQPVVGGGLDIWLDNTESTVLFDWTITLHERHGIGVTRAFIQRNDDTTVRAQITLGGGGTL